MRARANRAVRLKGLMRRVRMARSRRQGGPTRGTRASTAVFTAATTAAKAMFTRENWTGPQRPASVRRRGANAAYAIVRRRRTLLDSLPPNPLAQRPSDAKGNREAREGAQ